MKVKCCPFFQHQFSAVTNAIRHEQKTDISAGGFPTDTPESIARDIEIIKKELPVELLEFFFLPPLPGSEDHKNA